jgi:hypothetical protein
VEYIKDILLTEHFLVKCFIDTGSLRLSDYLDSLTRTFVPLRNVIMIDVEQGETVSSHEAQIRRDEIIVAHELLDVTGDSDLRNMMNQATFSESVDLYHTGALGLEISGKMRPEANEGMCGEKLFFVMLDVGIRGLDLSISPDLKRLTSMPYAIVNRKQIGYIFSR